jgi:ubiquitin-protein ligase
MDNDLNKDLIYNMASMIFNYYKQFEDKIFISTVVKEIKEYLEENNISHPINKIIENVELPIIKLDEYQEIFNEYKFKYYDGDFKYFHYKQIFDLTPNQITRLQKEFQILKKTISLNKEASIFFCVQKNNINKIKFMISGPKNTPYEYGLFIFDMTTNTNFPSAPPLVHLSNNGNVRFNPNLYNCGKVCLSLLGTWRGDKSEMWNINTSTFNQLIISIQSQILVDEPYFNEPSFETTIGTQTGIQESKLYNYNIRQYTLIHAMSNLIESKNYPEFHDVIIKYFKYQKLNIFKTLDFWLDEMPNTETKNNFKLHYDKFINLVDNL